MSSLTTSISSYSLAITRYVVHQFLMRSIRLGNLILKLPDKTELTYGQSEQTAQKAGYPVAALCIINVASFFGRIATSADIGFAEAYIAGDFTACNHHLLNVFHLFIVNRDAETLNTSGLLMSKLGQWANWTLHMVRRNSINGSLKNIEAHYDLSNELFATFLGPSWTYSCAYFGAQVDDEKVSLYDAQLAKVDMILDKARLNADCHLLDIGCGWGELGIRAAKRFGCRVTGITLSKEQLKLGRLRAEQAGVSNNVQFELRDYRDLKKMNVKFDRVVSVEMLEAVGHEFLGEFFSAIEEILKEDGLCVVQVITTPECRYEGYRKTTDFIQKHIFPGGVCPSFRAVLNGMCERSQLEVEDVENIGRHYARTLAEWRREFVESVEKGRVADAGFDDVFVRKWIYYLCYCEAGFASRTLGVLQIVSSRCNNTGTLG